MSRACVVAGVAALLIASSCIAPDARHVRRAPRPDDDVPNPPGKSYEAHDFGAAGDEFWRAVIDGDDVKATRRFASHLKRKLPPEKFAGWRETITLAYGAIKSWRQDAKAVDHDEEHRYYELQCTRSVVRARLTFHRGTKNLIDVNLVREDVYVPAPAPDSERIVSWTSVTVGPHLGATVASPRNPPAGRLPAVVLVPGVEAFDRDQTFYLHRPFRDLGDGLAARGVVTIRFDKRCFSYPGLCGRAFTVDDDLIQDAFSAAVVLRDHPQVDPSRIFILGHGLGGIVAGAIARRAGDVAGLVLISVPARPLLHVSLEEARSHEPPEDVMAHAAAEVQSVLDGKALPSASILGVPAAYWYDLAKRDPFADVRGLSRPVLLIRGEVDSYATAADHQRWVRELAPLKVRAETIPLVNHGMLPTTPIPAARAQFGTGVQGPQVPEYLIDLVADFVTRSPPVRGKARRK